MHLTHNPKVVGSCPSGPTRSDKFRFRSELIRFTRIPDHDTVTSVARESVRTAPHSGPAIHRILPHPAQRRLPRNGRPALPRPLAAAPHRRAAFRAPQRILRHQTFRPRARPPARHDVRHPCTSVSLPDHIRRGGGNFFTMRSSPDYLFRPLHSGSCAPICASI